jgi:hypothetical protein
MQNGNINDDEGLKAPPRLVAALQQAAQTKVFIPPTLDEAVIRAGREHLAKPGPRRPYWLRLLLWSTAPATLVVFLLVRHSPDGFAGEDLNRDGKVDILDAFQLARELRSPTTPGQRRDFNNDGAVDQLDVEWIAAEAVKLPRGGRS